MIKEKIHYEDLTHKYTVICTQLGRPKYIKQLLSDLKEETYKNTIIERDLNTPLTAMDKLSKQEGNTGFKQHIRQMAIINICRNTHRTFSKVNHVLGHKTTLKKFKKIVPIPSIFLLIHNRQEGLQNQVQ